MHFRKFFSGTIDSLPTAVGTGTTNGAAGGGGLGTGYRSLKTTPILCSAIVEVLRMIGLDQAECSLDPDNPATYGEIFPYGSEKQGIQFFFGYKYVNSAHSYINVGLYPDSSISAANVAANSAGVQSQLQITSATSGTDVAYRFYVTVKGDPKSFVKVMVGSYSSPESETDIFGFAKGKDCFGNTVVCYAPFGGAYAMYFFDLDKKTYVNQATPVTAADSSSQAANSVAQKVKGCPPEKIALIPWIETFLLGVTLDNCYCVPTALTAATTDQAFLIGGEEYWLMRNGKLLAKCPTRLQLS